METKFIIETSCAVEFSTSDKGTKVEGVNLLLNVSQNLNMSSYIDEHGLPTKDGSQCATVVLVQGLVANLHHAHDKGFRDSAEHLRFIIAELEKGFSLVAKLEIGTYPKEFQNDKG